jgi:hypothetical protein
MRGAGWISIVFAKTPATLEEIRWRVAVRSSGIRCAATSNSTSSACPAPSKGNWTISLRSVAPDALWEASDIVADIQEAYDLARRGLIPGRFGRFPRFSPRLRAPTARLSLNYHPVFGKGTQAVGGMETFVDQAITIVALTCLLVVGAAATAFSAATAYPPARVELASAAAAPAARGPVSNKETRRTGWRSRWRWPPFEPPQQTAALSEPLRQAYASTAPADIGDAEGSQSPRDAAAALAPPKPKAAAKPPAAKELRAAQRRPDRRHQGAPETVAGAGILLAGGGDRAARGRPQDSRDAQADPNAPACRSIPRPKKSSN